MQGKKNIKWIIIIGIIIAAGTGLYYFYSHQGENPNGKLKLQENYILIDKSINRLYLFKAEECVKEYPVSTGEEPHLTPEGTYRIVKKIRNPGGAFGSRWMGLDVPGHEEGLKYGIHGTDEPEKIGDHVSGGCIRLKNEHIEELYNLVPEGMMVYIRY